MVVLSYTNNYIFKIYWFIKITKDLFNFGGVIYGFNLLKIYFTSTLQSHAFIQQIFKSDLLSMLDWKIFNKYSSLMVLPKIKYEDIILSQKQRRLQIVKIFKKLVKRQNMGTEEKQFLKDAISKHVWLKSYFYDLTEKEKKVYKNIKTPVHRIEDIFYFGSLELDEYEKARWGYVLDFIEIKLGTKEYKNQKARPLLNHSNIQIVGRHWAYNRIKYARVIASDAVSGGSSVLLAAFLGFLITEKFGVELVDSGDFWYLFMYVVFLGLIIRTAIITASDDFGWKELFLISITFNHYWTIVNYLWKKANIYFFYIKTSTYLLTTIDNLYIWISRLFFLLKSFIIKNIKYN